MTKKQKKKATPPKRGVVLLAVSHFTPGRSYDERGVKLQWDTCQHYADAHHQKVYYKLMIRLSSGNHFKQVQEEFLKTLRDAKSENIKLTHLLIRRDIRFSDLYRLRILVKKHGAELIEVPSNYEPGFHFSNNRQGWLSESLKRLLYSAHPFPNDQD